MWYYYYIYFILWHNKVIPTTFSTVHASPIPLPQRWLVHVVLYCLQLCYKQQSVHLSHLSIHIVFFQYTSTWFWFSLLEVRTVFRSLIHFPHSLSDWLLLLPVAAITSVLCIIKIFPIWAVCHGYWKSAVCSIPKSRKGRYLYCNWINITFSLKRTSALTETTSNGDV